MLLWFQDVGFRAEGVFKGASGFRVRGFRLVRACFWSDGYGFGGRSCKEAESLWQHIMEASSWGPTPAGCVLNLKPENPKNPKENLGYPSSTHCAFMKAEHLEKGFPCCEGVTGEPRNPKP